MRSRSGWLAVAGLVAACGAACTGQLTDDDEMEPYAPGGAGGKAGLAGSAGSNASAGTGGMPLAGGPAKGGSGGSGGRWNGGDPPDCRELGSCGGMAGDSAGGAAAAGEAGAGGSADDFPGECDSGRGCVVAQASAIPDLTADTGDLYWVEHGTFDELGNYGGDGRLMKRGLVSGTNTELAKGLSGPVSVALTTTHAFMYLDQVWDGKLRFSLARVPIAGGTAEVVQLDAATNESGAIACPRCLVHAGDTLYFPLPTGVYKIAAQEAQPTLFSPLRASALAIAADYLYVLTRTADAIWRVPLAGGAAEQISADPRQNIQVWKDYVYSLDTRSSSSYLARMPITGGPWLRLPKPQSGFAEQLQIVGSSFFYSLRSQAGQQFVVGSLTDSASALVPLVVPGNAAQAWVGTAQGIFWSSGRVIRQRLNAP